jgi:hypothetical protein
MADPNHSNQFDIMRRSLFAFSTTGIMENWVLFPGNGTSTAIPPIDPAVVIGADIFKTTLSWIEPSKGGTVDNPHIFGHRSTVPVAIDSTAPHCSANPLFISFQLVLGHPLRL